MKVFGRIARFLSGVSAGAETTNTQLRTNQYGELHAVQNNSSSYAAEGSYYIATNPTIGTAVALTAAAKTAYTATAPSLLIFNNEASGGKNIVISHIYLICGSAGTGTTTLEMAITTEHANRRTSGGALRTPSNALASAANTSVASFYDASTAIVATADGAGTRILARARFRTGAIVAGDAFFAACGANKVAETGLLSGTGAALYGIPTPPFVIPPGASGMFHVWSAGQTAAPTYEYVVEWTER